MDPFIVLSYVKLGLGYLQNIVTFVLTLNYILIFLIRTPFWYQKLLFKSSMEWNKVHGLF